MKNIGADFYHNADDMDKIMRERNARMMKLVIITVVVIVGGVAVLNFV